MGYRDIAATQVCADYSRGPQDAAYVEAAFRRTPVIRGRSLCTCNLPGVASEQSKDPPIAQSERTA